jgi:hypothetical protein
MSAETLPLFADAPVPPLSPLELQLLDALERLHCGGLCVGSADFDPPTWRRDLDRAVDVMVRASRIKAGVRRDAAGAGAGA